MKRVGLRARLPVVVRIAALCLLAIVGAFYLAAGVLIVALKWINPPATTLQIERRIQAWRSHKPYTKRQKFVPLSAISTDLRHAVVAAEDTRFAEHSGIDWVEMHKVLEQDLSRGSLGRGASTISQQLVKNLFFGPERSLLRKAVEFTLVPGVEWVLGKDRILELYLNVIEWGPGVYGAEAASRYWYRIPAEKVGRDDAARLAALIPNPLRRKPDKMDRYTGIILARMRQMGW